MCLFVLVYDFLFISLQTSNGKHEHACMLYDLRGSILYVFHVIHDTKCAGAEELQWH